MDSHISFALHSSLHNEDFVLARAADGHKHSSLMCGHRVMQQLGALVD